MVYKVSIIVPVYNVEKYLEESLDSLVNQTLKEIEIICINDASPDNSLDILHRYKKKYINLIKIIDLKKNVGSGYARNHGLDVAQGEYIVFVDPDDYVDITMCEKLYNMAKKKSADIIQFDYIEFWENNNKNDVYHNTKQKYFHESQLCASKEKFISKAGVMPWLRFYHRFIWEEIRFPELFPGEDVAVYIFPLIKAKKIMKFEGILYFYRRRAGSLMSSYGGGNIKNELKMLEFIMIESLRLNLIPQHEKVIFLHMSKTLCKELFKYRDGLYKNAPKSIYDQDFLLENHFKKVHKVYPAYLEKIIKYSKLRERIKLKMFVWKPVWLKNILSFSFACRGVKDKVFK